jgi:membrane protein required for colicin V production
MFTFVDGVVAVVLLASAGMAFLRGFVHEVLAIGAWAGAAFVAYAGFPTAQPWFRGQIASAQLADVAAGLSLFIVALVIFSLVTKSVANRVRRSALNSVDSSLGFVFGLVRGALVLSVAYIGVTWLIAPDEPPTWLAQAKTRPWLQRGAALIEGMLPEGFGRGERRDDTQSRPHATGNLLEDVKRAEDLAATVGGALALPRPAAPVQNDKAATKSQGYDKDQRRDMDRLFNTNK